MSTVRLGRDLPRHVFVGNLPWSVDEDEVHRFLEELVGGIAGVGVPRTPTGRGKGCALVSLEDETAVGFAVAQINRATFRGRPLRAQPTRRP